MGGIFIQPKTAQLLNPQFTSNTSCRYIIGNIYIITFLVSNVACVSGLSILDLPLRLDQVPMGSIGSSLGPQNLGGLQSRCIIFLTLLILDFHTYAVITYCTTTLQ